MYQKKDSSILKHFDFLVLDMAVVEGSFVLSSIIWNGIDSILKNQLFILMVCLLLLVQFAVAIFDQTYQDIIRRCYLVELKKVFIQNTMVMLIVFSVMFIAKLQAAYSRMVLLMTWALCVVLMYGERLVWKRYVRKRLRNSDERSHLLVVSDYESAEYSIKKLREKIYQPYKVTGIVVYDRLMKGQEIQKIPVVADWDEIFEYTTKNVVDEVFLNIEMTEESRKNIVDHFLEMGVTVHINLEWEDNDMPNSYVESLGECSVLTTCIKTATPYQLFTKRLMDIVGSFFGLILTGILFLIFAPVIYIQSPGPVFFSQQRIGKNGRRFRIYKFRSMYMDAEERKKDLMEQNKMNGLMFKMDNDPRIIPIGKFIRKFSIDEFPQFWNVLKGDMSLVGTRPPTLDEFEQYDPHHKVRLSIKPGLTGMWQVSGRSDITDFEEIVKLDNMYIKEWCLRLDLKILWMTVWAVLRSRGSV